MQDETHDILFFYRKEIFDLTMHSTYFIYSLNMASDIWQRATLKERKSAATTTWATISD